MNRPAELAPSQRDSSEECIGLIGVGLMGAALAERLLAGGFAVRGWDINPERGALLSGPGGRAVGGASEVVANCNRVILSLPDINVVEAFFAEVRAQARVGQTFIDTSTNDPDRAAILGEKLAKAGLYYMDATVSGSSDQVRNGEVTLMVGGSKVQFDCCQDLFQLFSKQAIYTGPCGSGSKMKLVTNLVLGLNRAALAEGLAFAKAMGLDLEQTLSVLMAGMAYSRIMETKGQKMLTGNFEPQARLSQHLKDVRLIIQAGANAGLALPLSGVHRQLLEIAESAGFGRLDNSAIIRAFSQTSTPLAKK